MEHASANKAAQALNLTQPAVTKSIQALEKTFGSRLFVRTNVGLAPTEFALLLRQRVKSLLAEFRDLAEEANAFLTGGAGHVVVGTLISAASRILPKTIALLEQQAPHVHITVREGTAEDLYKSLALGELTIVVGRVPDASSPWMRNGLVRSEVLLPEVLCVVVGAHHPLGSAKRISLDKLRRYRWILPLANSPTRRLVDQMFASADLKLPPHTMESLSLLTNLGVLLNSESIGVLTSSPAKEFARFGLLRILPVPKPMPFGQIGFSVRGGRPLTPATQRFVQCLRDAVAAMRLEDRNL